MRTDVKDQLEFFAERWEFRRGEFDRVINVAVNNDSEAFEDDDERVQFVRDRLSVVEEFARYWGEVLQEFLLAETEEETV